MLGVKNFCNKASVLLEIFNIATSIDNEVSLDDIVVNAEKIIPTDKKIIKNKLCSMLNLIIN